ncbi:hypothetical protein ACOMHN_043256 [Nucella lapillus]
MSSPPRHTFLSLFLSSLLFACVPARSLRDENMQILREIMAGNAEPDYTTFLHRLLTLVDDYVARNSAESGLRRPWLDEEEVLLPPGLTKRVTWTPLGHLPASARIGRPQGASRPHVEGSGTSVFRYG